MEFRKKRLQSVHDSSIKRKALTGSVSDKECVVSCEAYFISFHCVQRSWSICVFLLHKNGFLNDSIRFQMATTFSVMPSNRETQTNPIHCFYFCIRFIRYIPYSFSSSVRAFYSMFYSSINFLFVFFFYFA